MSRHTHSLFLGEDETGQSPDTLHHSRFVPREGTQRHCDHLDALKSVKYEPNERRIERDHVARFLRSFTQPGTNGYWEVHRQPSEDAWVTLIRFKTFELLVKPPPGHTITLVPNLPFPSLALTFSR